MRITLKSPAAGHSAGDTANVREDYARWLVSQGYAIEASTSTQHEDVTQNTSSEATRTRRTKRGEPKVTQRDDDTE